MMKTDDRPSQIWSETLEKPFLAGSEAQKNNAQDHLKTNYHITASRILRERACEKGGEDPQQTEAEKLAATLATNQEESILFHVQQLNQKQREQLLKKF